MFIQTEATPNPSTLKFLPGRDVLGEGGTMEFASRDAGTAGQSPLAERLFGIKGVTGVFYGSDFVTVTKDASEWQHLKPAILGAIMEHYMSGGPLLAGAAGAAADDADEEDEFFNEADTEIVATIKEVIETRVRPAVANDCGDITFRGFKDGIVYLDMRGACAGLPVVDGNAEARHPEPAEALRARGGRSAADGLTLGESGYGGRAQARPFCAPAGTNAWMLLGRIGCNGSPML